VPYGPEVSWPQGFRPLDTESRELLQSAFDASDTGPRRVPDYGQDPLARRPADGGTPGRGFAYQQPAMEDYGYGDPGYSDPSYDGPRSRLTGPQPVLPPTGPAFPAGAAYPGASPFTGGTTAPGSRWYSGGGAANRAPGTEMPGYSLPEPGSYQQPGYSVPAAPSDPFAFSGPSGSDNIYPVTGAQEALPDTGPQPIAGYPEDWYGHPRLDDTAVDQPPVPRDPRLEGIRYDELRYDEPDGQGYDEPLDDESWFRELRRGGSAFPSGSAGPDGGQRRVDPPPPSFSQAGPGPGHGGGNQAARVTPTTWSGSSQPGNWTNPQTPRMQADADRDGRRPGEPTQVTQGLPTAGFLGAPPAPSASVGVLTPPDGTPVQDDAFLAGPSAAPFLGAAPARSAPGVRPGHGLDGPEITSSWPSLPSSADQAFDEFWQSDDGQGNYSGLFEDEARLDEAEAKPGSKRRIGRRRGRSNDHRLWLALGGVVVVTAAAVAGVLKFELPAHANGPEHTMATPNSIGNYVRKVGLEKQTDLPALRNQVIKMSSGQASNVVSAVYESGQATSGGSVQMIMFIGGHLANASPTASINGFTQQFPGAAVVSAGPLGGKAACVEEQAGSADSKSICVFFDNDSFGTLVSPTMSASSLAKMIATIRPAVETVSRP
jgi:hypothetical protein